MTNERDLPMELRTVNAVDDPVAAHRLLEEAAIEIERLREEIDKARDDGFSQGIEHGGY